MYPLSDPFYYLEHMAFLHDHLVSNENLIHPDAGDVVAAIEIFDMPTNPIDDDLSHNWIFYGHPERAKAITSMQTSSGISRTRLCLKGRPLSPLYKWHVS